MWWLKKVKVAKDRATRAETEERQRERGEAGG